MTSEELRPRLDGTTVQGWQRCPVQRATAEQAGHTLTLRWEGDAVPRAVIGGLSVGDLVDVLQEAADQWSRSSLLASARRLPLTGPAARQWAALASSPAEEALCRALVVTGDLSERTESGKRLWRTTPLDLTSGQQGFVSTARRVASLTDTARLRQLLTGSAVKEPVGATFGWGANEQRIYALRATDPAKEPKRSVPAADFLALLGLGRLPLRLHSTTDGPAVFHEGSERRYVFKWRLWGDDVAHDEAISRATGKRDDICRVLWSVLRRDAYHYGYPAPYAVGPFRDGHHSLLVRS